MVTNKGFIVLCLYMTIGGAVAPTPGDEDPVSENSVKAVCNPDNTVDVTIVYDKNATILGLTYGSCTESSARVSGHTGWSDSGWNVSLDVEACDMGDTVRTIQYEQNATFTVGVNDGMELVFAVFTVASFCEYTKSYKVKFSYGALEAEEEIFGASGGTLDVAFTIKSMSSNFTKEETASTVAGNHIYLALSVNSTAFPDYDHADNFTATSGKLFAPKSCAVFAGDSSGNMTYTLFGPDKCDNEFISLEISYDDATNSWHISHILFLLGDLGSSSYELICTVIVCDASDSGDCATVHDCLTAEKDKEVCVPTSNWQYVYDDREDIKYTCGEMYTVIKRSYDGSSYSGLEWDHDDSICGAMYMDSGFYQSLTHLSDNRGHWKFHCCPQNYPATKLCDESSAGQWSARPQSNEGQS